MVGPGEGRQPNIYAGSSRRSPLMLEWVVRAESVSRGEAVLKSAPENGLGGAASFFSPILLLVLSPNTAQSLSLPDTPQIPVARS